MPLLLPQAHIFFESEQTDACQVVVLGGRAPALPWLSSVGSGRIVWAVDRGVDACMAAGIIPNHVVGDFDSISKEAEAWLERRSAEAEIEIKRFPAEKDCTDFQICLNLTKGDLLVTGCWGGRFDHAYANIFSALWGVEWGAIVRAFADDSEVLIPLAAEARSAALELRLMSEASAISLLPLCESCEGVSIQGTKWELNGAKLAQRRPYAVSNVPAGEKISVKIERGVVGVYCFFE